MVRDARSDVTASEPDRVKIAIVGTGVSGLVCAHRLHARHEITVFEADSRIGGHVNTVEIAPGLGVDTGFIVYNETTYPSFTWLLAELGIETQPSDMSFSVRCEDTGLEWASRGLTSVFADPRNLFRPSFIRMLRESSRFQREARALLDAPEEKLSLAEFVETGGYAREFVDHCLVPMAASIWSTAPDRILEFPAASFVRFFENHGLLSYRSSIQWRVVCGGSSRYVEKLASPFRNRIRLATPVRAVRRRPKGVEVLTDGRSENFDRVVLAVHSDQALSLLDEEFGVTRRVLSGIRYQSNEAILHSDSRSMPRRRRAWASWNYRLRRDAAGPPTVTYHMNRLQGIDSDTDYFVTLNDASAIDPRLVWKRVTYHHPILDADAIAAQRFHSQVDGQGGVHLAGAYWGYGFHEDGVRSALAACARLETG
jgi:predicted NAD/FAD-binding protein